MSAIDLHMQDEGLPKNGMMKLALDSENVLLDADVWRASQQPAALDTLGQLMCLQALRTGA